MELSQDAYGTVFNSKATYFNLAAGICAYPRVIAWTDGASSQLDILFVYRPLVSGPLQRGMNSESLFVAVSGFGMFGFALNGQEKHPSYVAEKLGLSSPESITAVRLADLINGICKELDE